MALVGFLTYIKAHSGERGATGKTVIRYSIAESGFSGNEAGSGESFAAYSSKLFLKKVICYSIAECGLKSVIRYSLET